MSCNGMAFFQTNFMLHTPHEDEHQPTNSLNPILPSCTPQDFHGVVSFLGKRSMSFSGIDVGEEANGGEDDLSDDGSQAGEKKRRLNMEQVKTLEKNFELGNKLDPERKIQLAMSLGLQPRQIAIWFQNRRARWKTKQLEKDYDLLKRQYEAVKADNEALHAQNQKLHAQIMALKSREVITESINLNKETEGSSSSNRSENSSDVKLDISWTPPAIDSPLSTQPITSINLFPTTTTTTTTTTRSSSRRPTVAAAQLFHNSSSSSRPDLQFLKLEPNNIIPACTKDQESLSSMFCGMDEQTGFWPWLEQHNFS